jgi:hypothetical protein
VIPSLSAEHIQHRNLDAEHLFQAIDDANEHPGFYGVELAWIRYWFAIVAPRLCDTIAILSKPLSCRYFAASA